MSSLIRLNNKIPLQNFINQAIRGKYVRNISTSQKNRETATIAHPIEQLKSETSSTTSTKKNWVSYGFSHKDEAEDRNTMKATFFFTVTLCLVWGTFVWSYLPDTQLRDWAQREGYLELRRREQAGADHISPNYVDPSKIHLPSDEELGDTEIII